MRRIAATAALAVIIGLGRLARGETAFLAGPPGAAVEVEADRIFYAWDKQVLRLEGHVVARRGPGLLRAGSATLDRARGILWLEGGVLGVQDRQVFLADAAVVDLNDRTAEMIKAVLFLKERAANPAAPRSGANALTLHGARVRQLQRGRFLAEEVSLTPCDCAGEPDYELWARTAEIGDDRADLRGVRLHLLGATLPLFPISLPLKNRQSGLLAPQIGGSGSVGFAYAQPIFVTLGPSYDLTLAPGVYTGGHQHHQTPNERSVKGPRLNLEGRYAPAAGTSGSLALDLYYDLDQHDAGSAGRGFGGVRGIARLRHRTESDTGAFAIQGLAASDVMAVRDLSSSTIGTSDDLFTTDVGFWRARGPVTLGADATLLQDMRIDPDIDRALISRKSGATVHRVPAVFAQVAPLAVGPVTFSAEASAVQFARFGSPDARERETGFGPTDRGTPVLPSLGYDGSRAPALRLDLSPRVSLSGSSMLPIALRLEAGARVDGWVTEGFPDRDRARAYALIGARAALPLERRYGSALHRIEPALEIRAVSKHLGAGGPPIGDLTDAGGATFAASPDAAQQGLAPGGTTNGVPAARRPYDEIDFAAPVTGAVQATASVSQSLWTKPGSTVGRLLRFDLLQDALLWAGGGRARLGETSARTVLQIGPASIDGTVRYDWTLHELSTITTSGGLRDRRGDEVHVIVSLLRPSSSERLRAGIDELFSTARFDVAPSPMTGSITVGGSAPLPHNLRIGYELIHYPGVVSEKLTNWQHVAAISVDTPCKCVGLQLSLSFPFHDARLLKEIPDYKVVIDLKSLGSFATF